MKNISLLFLLSLLYLTGLAQINIEQQVISSTSDIDTTTTLIVTSTIGEAVIQTLNPNNGNSIVLTQGFQQSFSEGGITFDLEITQPLCLERTDGFAEVSNIVGGTAPYTITWSNGNIGDRATSLSVGDYTIQITSDDGVTQNSNFKVESTNDLPCLLKFYSGITPNSDGRNDTWVIDNIELFPSNEVNIYNRLGNRVWEGINYDNNNVVWIGDNLSGNELPSDTYFYVFESGSNVEKGWIELTR